MHSVPLRYSNTSTVTGHLHFREEPGAGKQARHQNRFMLIPDVDLKRRRCHFLSSFARPDVRLSLSRQPSHQHS